MHRPGPGRAGTGDPLIGVIVTCEEEQVKEFRSWHSYRDFAHDVTQKSRYIWPEDVNDFLQTLLSTTKKRQKIIRAESFLWRAQLGHDIQPYYYEGEHIADEPAPFPSKRMKPLRGEAVEGRANPKGIPYLYLSKKRETALSEVRRWLGSLISVGQFKIIRQLRIVDFFSTEQRHLIFIEEPSPKERENAVWTDIDKAFSRPVNPSDKIAEYIPTQIIAERFKMEGFDGIAYRSAYTNDYNVMLFDIDVADIINCFLFEAKAINFNFSQEAGHYFVKKHYGQKHDNT
jgi:hypothetical protein